MDFNIKNFPQDFQDLPTNADIGDIPATREVDGKMFKLSAQRLAQNLSINGQRIKSVPAGPLPAQGPDPVYMHLRGPGTWNFGGNDIAVLTSDEVADVWWQNGAWTLDSEQSLPTAPVANETGTSTTQAASQDLARRIDEKADGAIADAADKLPKGTYQGTADDLAVAITEVAGDIPDTSNLAPKVDQNGAPVLYAKEDGETITIVSGTPASGAGSYARNTGTFIADTNNNYWSKEVDLQSIGQVGDIFIDLVLFGTNVAAAVYLDANRIWIGKQLDGTGTSQNINNLKLDYPENTRYILLTNRNPNTPVYTTLRNVVKQYQTDFMSSGGTDKTGQDLSNEIEVLDTVKASEINENGEYIARFEPTESVVELVGAPAEGTNPALIGQGYFSKTTGNIVQSNSPNSWRSNSFDVTGISIEDVFFDAVARSASTAMLYFYNGSTFLGWKVTPTTALPDISYVNQKIVDLPQLAGEISLANMQLADTIKITNYTGGLNNFGKLRHIVRSNDKKPVSVAEFEEYTNSVARWKGKRILWLGTSIPETGKPTSYPELVGQMLGAEVINNAKGSSMARRGKRDVSDGYGWTGEFWERICYSLSQTFAEKEELINNWDLWKTRLTAGATSPVPQTLTEAQKTLIRGCSYEARIIPYLDGTLQPVDLIVIDHGNNDNLGSDNQEQFSTVPAVRDDRNYFLGSLNFLVDTIRSYDARMDIKIMGHYENQTPNKVRIAIAQTNFAEYQSIAICKLWSMTGWSQQVVNTTGYWQDGVWYPSGGPVQQLTMTQVWMSDNLHPRTIEARIKLARNIAGWFNSIG